MHKLEKNNNTATGYNSKGFNVLLVLTTITINCLFAKISTKQNAII